MAVFKVTENVYEVGAIHWDREIFDELIPLPHGTSYNAYLIKGSEKVALIDTVDPETIDQLLANLKHLKVDRIDYIISSHAEQDHSGGIPELLKLYPEAKVVTNSKCKAFLIDLLHIPEEKFIEVGDGDTLSLGDKTLEFILTPWVHWPETMTTYLVEDKVAFTCDFFGSHLATTNMLIEEDPVVLEEAKRYYAEIMMPFRRQIAKNIQKLEQRDVEIIAPSHGPVYLKPEFIIEAYKDWIDDSRVTNTVILPYVSMHGSTKRMVCHFIDALVKRGIHVKPFNLTKADLGQLSIALVDAATLVVGTPMVLAGAHPAAIYGVFLVNALKPKIKFVSFIGSYGWGGRMLDQMKGLLTQIKPEILDPVVVKGNPRPEDFRKLDELADRILEKHREIGVI